MATYCDRDPKKRRKVLRLRCGINDHMALLMHLFHKLCKTKRHARIDILRSLIENFLDLENVPRRWPENFIPFNRSLQDPAKLCCVRLGYHT
jgi:hypothetical protein